MSKENEDRFIPQEIFGDTPATRRWFVVSINKAVLKELTGRNILAPSEEQIQDFVIGAKESPFLWLRVQDTASKIRRMEFAKVLKGVGEGAGSRENFLRAAAQIEKIYSEIDKDPERNCVFLDPLLFGK